MTRLFVTSHARRYKIEMQRFLVPDWFPVGPRPLPGGGKSEILVIANRFPISRLMFFAEVSSARFFSRQRVVTHQFAHLEVVGHATSLFQLAAHCRFPRHIELMIKLLTKRTN